MKKISLILFFCTALFFSHAQNVWIPRDSVNGPPRSAVVGFSINGLGYAGLGIDHTEYKRSFYRYDKVNDDWDRVESFGGPTGDGNERSSAVAFVIGGFAYVGLGQGANPYFGDFWKFDPVTDTWTQVADYGGTPRTQAAAFSIDNYGYAGTGQSINGLEKDFWKYDPAGNTWSPVADFGGTPRRQAVGVGMGGQGYVGTGDDGTFTNDFWQYEPSTDSWIQKASFPGNPRYGATGFAIFPQVFIGTGYDNTLSYRDDFWKYNFWNNTWQPVAYFSGGPRANAFSFTIGTRGYVGCGYNGVLLDDFYEYFPVVGVDELSYDKNLIKIYPNPSSRFITISISGKAEFRQIGIYSMSGRIIKSADAGNGVADKITIDCQDLPPGNYLCMVKNNSEIAAVNLFSIVR